MPHSESRKCRLQPAHKTVEDSATFPQPNTLLRGHGQKVCASDRVSPAAEKPGVCRAPRHPHRTSLNTREQPAPHCRPSAPDTVLPYGPGLVPSWSGRSDM